MINVVHMPVEQKDMSFRLTSLFGLEKKSCKTRKH